MTCSEINFLSSQAFYGLCISKGAELPAIDASDEEWEASLNRLVVLSSKVAEKQIAHNKGKSKC